MNNADAYFRKRGAGGRTKSALGSWLIILVSAYVTLTLVRAVSDLSYTLGTSERQWAPSTAMSFRFKATSTHRVKPVVTFPTGRPTIQPDGPASPDPPVLPVAPCLLALTQVESIIAMARVTAADIAALSLSHLPTLRRRTNRL